MTRCNVCQHDLKPSLSDFLCARCEPQCPPHLLAAYRKAAKNVAAYRRLWGLNYNDKAPDVLTDELVRRYNACREAIKCTAV